MGFSGRRGRLLIRLAAHGLCAVPLLWLGWAAADGRLGANPIEAVVRFLGDWGLRGLVLALAVTPLRRLGGWGRRMVGLAAYRRMVGLAAYRRMLGLWAFAYVFLHLAAYVGLDQFFDWSAIGAEIIKHKFITAGMAAFLLLLPLAATSTAGMIRRLGSVRWRRLHRAVYLAVPLAVLHYVWMVKADIHQPLLYAALTGVLLAVRMRFSRRSYAEE